jgi:hypothetical protein
VSTDKQEAAATRAIVVGAAVLFGSLFLTWSHQFSPGFGTHFGAFAPLIRSPRNPTAWQVYSAADVVLALVAAGLVAVTLFGGRTSRSVAGEIVVRVALTVAAIAFVFVLHALIAPPSNGALIYDPATRGYGPNSPAAGPGETVALAGLALALSGLLASLVARRRARVSAIA